MKTLLINEIIHTLQGEGPGQGLPIVIVRLTGCNLRCNYCDTTHAYETGTAMSLDEIIAAGHRFACPNVLVTGGEPLQQPGVIDLLSRLLELNMAVALETNGSLPIHSVPAGVVRQVDVKTPDSGAGGTFREENLADLLPMDQLKFVCNSDADIDWSIDYIGNHRLHKICAVALQPAWSAVPNQLLAERILASGLPIRLGMQLHKLVWGADAQHV